MSKTLSGLEGTVCQMDDVLIFERTKEEHDTRLMIALEKICSTGITLNKEMFVWSKQSKILRAYCEQEWNLTDKVTAIKQMETPKNISALRRFLEMVNQSENFFPNLQQLHSKCKNFLAREQISAGVLSKQQHLKPQKMSY